MGRRSAWVGLPVIKQSKHIIIYDFGLCDHYYAFAVARDLFIYMLVECHLQMDISRKMFRLRLAFDGFDKL